MPPRLPLAVGCTGGVDCPVLEHVRTTVYTNGRTRVAHVPLTRGQRRTLAERRRPVVRAITEEH